MHALACLLAASALAAAPAVDVPLGERSLPVEIALDVRTQAGGTASPDLAWSTRPDGALEGRARGPGFEAAVRLRPVAGGAREIDVAVRWTDAAEVERVAVRLAWRGAAPRAVSRDLAFGPLRRPLRTGRGTPILAAAGGAVLAGGPGFAAARLAPAAGGLDATLFLDDADERPFSTYAECLDRLPHGPEAQPIHWRELEVRRAMRFAPRAAGAVDEARATLHPLGASAPFLPVVVERWPAGARAAIVVTDHADRTDAAALRAVLWGSSDPRAEGGVLREGLAAAAAWHADDSADHEPYTNCEAVSSRGWSTDGPFGVRDLLEEAGIRWIWAAGDVDGRMGPRIVNLLGGDPEKPRPAVFPLPVDPALWVFRSSMFHAPPAELAAALSDAALASLERERGLFVAHTYLGPSPRASQAHDPAARLAVVEAGGGALAVHPALDAAFARIAARVAAGTLASLPWAEAGDRLRALGEIEVAYLPDGSAEIRNHGDRDVRALTLAIPAAGLEPTVEGTVLLGREEDGGATRIWLDLPAASRVVLRASDGTLPVAFLPFR